MKIQSLGHVVLKVGDRARAEAFYNGVLGLPIVARLEQYDMTFFSLGNHHDFAVMALGEGTPPAAKTAAGLLHVAFKIGETMDELREAKEHLERAGVETVPIDHGVTKSLYFHDPDGNEIEVYVDVSDAWKAKPQLVAQVAPLAMA